MRIGRTLSPAASPIYASDLIYGLKGLLSPRSALECFESDIKKKYGVLYCWLLSSGRAALCVILEALHRLKPERDTVVIPAYVCYSVPSAIIRAGLKIRLCDLDQNTLDYDYAELEKIIESDGGGNGRDKILAIIQVHLFGLVADTAPLKKLIGTHSEIAVIQDYAQALGAEKNGQLIGTEGDVNFFSLGRGKAYSTVEGGIVVTDRKDIADSIKAVLNTAARYTVFETFSLIAYALLLATFQHPLLFWLPKSLPFLKVGATIYDPGFEVKLMSGFQAGLARNWAVKINRFQHRRRANIERLDAALAALKLEKYSSRKNGLPFLIRYPVRLPDAGRSTKVLKDSEMAGLGMANTYPDTINHISELRGYFKGETYPNAEALVDKVVTLPIHPFVTRRDVMKIAALISKNIEACGRA